MISDGGPDGLLDGVLALELGVEGAELGGVAGAEGCEDPLAPLDVGCGVDGVVGFELGFELGAEDGLDEEPPRPIDSSGVGDDVGFELGAAGAAASLFTVEVVGEDDGAGLNTPLTTVPSKPSGSHQGFDGLELGALLGAEDGTEVAVWVGGAVLPVGAVVGTGLVGGAVADGGALDGRLDGAGCCGVLPLEDGCGAPGVGAAPGLLAEEPGVLGVEDGALVFGAA